MMIVRTRNFSLTLN